MFHLVGICAGILLLIYISWTIANYLIRLPVIKSTNQKYILITGCDRGLGKELTKRLDRTKYHIFAGCLTEKGASKLRQETSARVATFLMDVTKQENINKACNLIRNNLPDGRGLWAIVNNAGISGSCGPSEWLHLKDYRSCMEVNTLGTIRICNRFLPLVKMEQGRIVNMSCISGRASLPWMVPYSMSKYAVEAYSDSLRREMLDFNVSVHLIEPNFVQNDFSNIRDWQENLTRTWRTTCSDKGKDYAEDYFHDGINALPGILDLLVSKKTEEVLVAYEHAITAVYPRTRYVVGRKAFFHLLLHTLPESVGDFILHFHLSKHLGYPQTAPTQRNPLEQLSQAAPSFLHFGDQ